MNVLDAMWSRKSVRGYKPDPVPKEVISKILEVATHCPSQMNTQPWEITVVTGKVLDELKGGNVAMLASGAKPDEDLPCKPRTQPHEGVYRQRQVELAIQLFGLMGIGREDKEKRARWTGKGFRFFDAPVALILTVDRSVDEWPAMLGLGALIQSICLAAMEYGLGTCVADQGVLFSSVVRKVLSIPESNRKRIVIGIAMGYPDGDFPANKLQTKREPLEKLVNWAGFD